MDLATEVLRSITKFYLDSHDFNGMPVHKLIDAIEAEPEEIREALVDRLQDYHTIVGLAVGELKPDHPLYLFYLCKPEWNEEDQRRAKEAREELGFFKSPIF